MRWEGKGLLAVILASSFFIYNAVFSANSDIIINEIGAYPTSTHEWVEIWNKGNDPVDLTGWIFWENKTNHHVSATGTSDAIVSPGEYAAIVQNGDQFRRDYPMFGGSIFDSSWASLSELGEEIGLKDGQGNTVEQFMYGPVQKFSLERKDPFLNEYGVGNWQEHSAGNSLGVINSNFLRNGATSSAQVVTSTSGGASSSTTAENVADEVWSRIRLNEIMVDPESGSEWVELFNPTANSLDLSGGTICDSRAETDCVVARPTSTLAAGQWVAVYLSGSHLNNDDDGVVLKNQHGGVVDQVVYGNGGVEVPKKGQTLARRVDGVGGGTAVSDWAITTVPTPGESNRVVEPVLKNVTGQTAGSGGSSATTAVSVTAAVKKNKDLVGATSTMVVAKPLVAINELYPNPAGSETDEEFLEIKNISTSSVQLRGWRVEVGDARFIATSSNSLAPGELLVLKRKTTALTLRNSGDIVSLFDERGWVVGRVQYDTAPSGQSYNRLRNGEYSWSRTPTPGQENRVVVPDSVKIVWRLSTPKRAVVGKAVDFSVEGSVDPRGGSFFYNWNFGDGGVLDGSRVNHVFASSGVYTVLVTATSTAGTVGQRQITTRVGERLENGSGQVVLSEVFPNPNGSDASEFVEIKNESEKPLEIGGWSIRQQDKKFVIPENTTINAGGVLVFRRVVTGIVLGNRGAAVELYDESGNLVDEIDYSASTEGKSYALVGDVWVWAGPSPGWVDVVANKKDIAELGEAKMVKKNRPVVGRSGIVRVVGSGKKDAGRIATVTGVVSVLPGVLGSQYFYLATDVGGVQVFQSKKDFPDLRIGDLVSVRGKLHEVGGEQRLTMSGREAVDVLDSEQGVIPARVDAVELGQQMPGGLAEVTGEITELNRNFMYIDDGVGEVLVYFKRGTGIDSAGFHEGDEARVVGVVSLAKQGKQLLPRSIDDIRLIGKVKKQDILTEASAGGVTETYLSATAGGVTTLLLGALAKYRGALLKAGVIRAGKILVCLVRRNQV
jgi:Lamin Tail Domain/PKD domain